MAWTAPMTAVANATWTSAQFNAHVRDNLLETEAGKATAVGRYMVATGTNSIAERITGNAIVTTSQTTSSTSFTDLTTVGPAVTLTTGTSALVSIACTMSDNTANHVAVMSYAVSGATTSAAADNRSVSITPDGGGQQGRWGMVFLHTGLTAGSNTFTAKYRVSSGAGIGTFSDRRITVLPF